LFDFKPWLEDLGLGNITYRMLWTAFTHKSYKGMVNNAEDNERLEFLGDAVLDLIIAEDLFEDKSLNEADMTELRKKNVNNDNLARIFDILKLDLIVRIANNLPLSNKVKAGLSEAFFGVIYKEKGYTDCVELWRRIQLIFDNNHSSKIFLLIKNAKSVIQEYCQSKQFDLRYYMTEKSGPDHDPVFTAEINLSPGYNRPEFERVFKTKEKPYVNEYANGRSKKHAEMRAAEKMCDRIGLKYSSGD